MASRAQPTLFAEWWWTVDRLTLAALGALMLGGIVLSLAASPPVATRIGLDPFHFVNRQVLFLRAGHRRFDCDLVFVAAGNPPGLAHRLCRQPRSGRHHPLFRRRDQRRAALAGDFGHEHPALGVFETRFRGFDRLAVR